MTTETKRDSHADLALCEAATPGPWRKYGGKFGETNVYHPPYGNHDEVVSDIDFDRTHDAEFIAESREGWPEAIHKAVTAEAEVEKLREILGYIYQKARNDCAMWDGKMCVGLPVFQDRIYARKLVRELSPILFPEVTADATR